MPPRGKKKSKRSRKPKARSRKAGAARSAKRTARSRGSASRKTSARKSAARKSAARKSAARKSAARKSAAKRGTKRSGPSRKSSTAARRRVPAPVAAQPATLGSAAGAAVAAPERDELESLGTDELMEESDIDLGGDDDLEGM